MLEYVNSITNIVHNKFGNSISLLLILTHVDVILGGLVVPYVEF